MTTDNLELMKKQLELKKVTTARFEYEVKIQERLEDIDRIKVNIDKQDARISELKEEISQLRGAN